MALGFIPIGRAEHSSALMRGELIRYLAELAWAPHAILLNTAVRWRVDGPDTLALSAGGGETVSEVLLNLDSDGRIGGAFAAWSVLRLSPSQRLVASVLGRSRLGNRGERNSLLASTYRELGYELSQRAALTAFVPQRCPSP
jgi:hypothetical protein